MVTGLFILCWLPFFLVTLLYKFCAECESFVSDMRVLMAIKMLHYGNSVLNPIIYAVRNQRFNSAFRRILRRLCCCEKSQEVEGQSLVTFAGRSTKSTKKPRQLTIVWPVGEVQGLLEGIRNIGIDSWKGSCCWIPSAGRHQKNKKRTGYHWL